MPPVPIKFQPLFKFRLTVEVTDAAALVEVEALEV